MRGVPVRVEVGPRDIAQDEVTLARRDQPGREGKRSVPVAQVRSALVDLLDEVQGALYAQALDFQRRNTRRPLDFEAFTEAVSDGWAEAWWCGDSGCEGEIKAETRATTRCIPLDQPEGEGECIHCGRRAVERAIFGRAY